MAIGMHVHPHFDPPARLPARTTARARWARGRSVAEVAEGVMRCGAARKRTVMDTKKAGRAAPPGESLFSSLFNVAARGGKSPRVSIVWSVYGRSAASSSPVGTRFCVRGSQIRDALRRIRPLPSRDSRASCRGRSCVPRALRSVRRCDPSLPHACLAAALGRTYISRTVVIPPSPTRRPIRSTRSRGDLTVTTRPGVVAFHRSPFSRLAPPCSGGGASCGAAVGANFNREAHT